MEQLRTSSDERRFAMDNEMNEMSANEMVDAHEASGKHTVTSATDLADVRKMLADSENALRQAKKESEELEHEQEKQKQENDEIRSRIAESWKCGACDPSSMSPDDTQCKVSTCL